MAQPGADAPLLEVRNVAKSFAGVAALRDLSLDVARGELFALLGASGSGKTTLLRLIAGLEQPDSGRILIAGADQTGVPAYRRPVNTVFQSYALFPHMTVAANVEFGLRQDGMRAAERRARTAEMLALVQLAALAERRPQELSGGQRQRVALARALARLPKLLLLDEPMAALDRRLREQTRGDLVALQRRLGIAFVLVTHDQEEAMTTADRIGVMDEGALVQVGTPADIYERPVSRFVAGFVGQVNLFAGRVAAMRGGVAVIASTEGLGELRAVCADALAPGTQAWIAVRPERLRLVAPGDRGGAANAVPATLRRVAYRGEALLVQAEAEGGRLLRALLPNLGGAAGMLPPEGSAVALSWDDAAGRLLTR